MNALQKGARKSMLYRFKQDWVYAGFSEAEWDERWSDPAGLEKDAAWKEIQQKKKEVVTELTPPIIEIKEEEKEGHFALCLSLILLFIISIIKRR